MRNNLIYYGITVAITLILAVLWEFYLEELIPGLVFDKQAIEAPEEKWEFVLISVAFVSLALILPTIYAVKNERKRKHLEGQLRLTQYSVDMAGDAVFWLIPDNKLVYVNEHTSNLLQYQREELLEITALDISPDFSINEWNKHWENVKAKGSIAVETNFQKKNGEKFPVEITMNYVNFEETELVCAFVRDITERKKAEIMLKQFSYEDSLTKTANRRIFDIVLEKEWNRALRSKNPLSAIMIDIDCFKLYNDTYGHQAGDKCLQWVANTIKNSVSRSGDFVARYGGEEFSVILPATTINNAYNIAEAIRTNIESMKMPHKSSIVSDIVTISAGVSTVFPNKGLSHSIIVKQADECLYQAKHDGRNKVFKIDE